MKKVISIEKEFLDRLEIIRQKLNVSTVTPIIQTALSIGLNQLEGFVNSGPIIPAQPQIIPWPIYPNYPDNPYPLYQFHTGFTLNPTTQIKKEEESTNGTAGFNNTT